MKKLDWEEAYQIYTCWATRARRLPTKAPHDFKRDFLANKTFTSEEARDKCYRKLDKADR